VLLLLVLLVVVVFVVHEDSVAQSLNDELGGFESEAPCCSTLNILGCRVCWGIVNCELQSDGHGREHCAACLAFDRCGIHAKPYEIAELGDGGSVCDANWDLEAPLHYILNLPRVCAPTCHGVQAARLWLTRCLGPIALG
jgi:hypothetical protein